MVVSHMYKWLIGALACIVLSSQLSADDFSHSQYRLGAGDVISVRVFGEEDLTFEKLRLTDAGTFSFPFLSEVRAAGKTAAELEKTLTEALKGDYLVDPKVSVGVEEYRNIFVNGEVRQPGGYPFQPGITVRAAAALAGGLTERASEKRITVIRENDPSKTPHPVDLNSAVMPGDIITIEQSFF